MTTLKRGDAVSVQLTVSSSEGNWCEVTGFAGSGTSGFMRCADLEREPAVRKPPATYIAPAPPPTAAGKPPAVAPRPRPAPLSLVEIAVREYLYPVQRWAEAFDFTADQQTALTELAGRIGVTACRKRMEAHVKEYEPEHTYPLRTPPRERVVQMVRDYNRFAHPCMMKRLELLERLPAMLTPGQQANTKLLTSLKKELAKERRALTSPGTFPGIALPR